MSETAFERWTVKRITAVIVRDRITLGRARRLEWDATRRSKTSEWVRLGFVWMPNAGWGFIGSKPTHSLRMLVSALNRAEARLRE